MIDIGKFDCCELLVFLLLVCSCSIDSWVTRVTCLSKPNRQTVLAMLPASVEAIAAPSADAAVAANVPLLLLTIT